MVQAANLVPFPESYWVVPDKFLAGEHPCKPIIEINSSTPFTEPSRSWHPGLY